MTGMASSSHSFRCLMLLALAQASLADSSAQQERIALTFVEPVTTFVAQSGATYTICHSQKAPFNVMSMFNHLSINVVATESYKFPWHSIRGLSSDDFHSNIETIMFEIFGTEEEKADKMSVPAEFRQSFFRDIVSACPSPLLSTYRSQCLMSFSPFGEACVRLRTDQSVELTATSERKFNIRLPLSLLCGLILLNLSHPLSKSSIFQYSSGVILFIVGGFLVLGWFLSKRVVFGSKGNVSNTELTGMTALLAGSYGASTVWFLRAYLRTICLKYAEYGAAYVLVMACLGMSFVRLVRNMEGSKHVLRVGVKWLLRLSGLVFIFNCTASPMLSLAALGVLSVIYMGHVAVKGVRESSVRKETKLANGR